MIALAAVLYMVLMGTKPFSVKEKTVPFTGDGDSIRQLWYVSAFVLAIIARLFSWKTPKPRLPLSIMACLALFWLSSFWAIDPSISIRRLALTNIIVILIFWSVYNIGFERSIRLITYLLMMNLVMNYAALLLTPVAVHGFEANDPGIIGDWRGVMAQKNYAGAVCSILILIVCFHGAGLSVLLRLATTCLSGYFLYRTHSKTSEGLLGFCLVLGLLFRFYNVRFKSLVIPIVAIIFSAIIFALYLNWADIRAVLDDPRSFTGRSLIWTRMLGYIRDHPLTGAGFGSFWNIGPESPSFSYANGWVAGMATAHNGYLDLLAQTGIFGLALSVLAVIIIPIVKIFVNPEFTPAQRSAVSGVLIFCILHNLTETSLFDRDAIVQVFLMISIALINSSATGRLPRNTDKAALVNVVHGTRS